MLNGTFSVIFKHCEGALLFCSLSSKKKEALFAEFLRKRLRYFSQIIPLLIKVALKHLVYM